MSLTHLWGNSQEIVQGIVNMDQICKLILYPCEPTWIENLSSDQIKETRKYRIKGDCREDLRFSWNQ